MPDRRGFLTWAGAAMGVGAAALSGEKSSRAEPGAQPISAAPPTLNPAHGTIGGGILWNDGKRHTRRSGSQPAGTPNSSEVVRPQARRRM